MKVQLVRPALNDWYNVTQLQDNVSYPVGLCLLSKILRDKGVEVEVIDGHRKPLEYVLERLRADFVGVTSLYSNYENALKILEAAKNKGARTIIGGANITHLAPRILRNRPFIDFAVVNDGEEALPEIVLGNPGESTPNLVYREGNQVLESRVRRNAPLTTVFDLQNLIDKDSWMPFSAPVSGIRGCLKAELNDLCDFCSIDHKLSVMDPRIMWQQVRVLKSYGITHLWEIGETLFQGYLTSLLNARPKDLEDVKWKFYICADLVDEKMGQSLAALGTREVQMGIETPNDSILEKVGKKARSGDIERAIEIVSKHGINLHLGILYGLTGETTETARRTYEFIQQLVKKYQNVTKITTSHVLPLFGTGMFKRLASHPDVRREYPGNLDTDDIFDYTSLTKLHTKYFTTADFDELDKFVLATRKLMDGRGYSSSFQLEGEGKHAN